MKSSKSLSCTKAQCNESYCYNCIKRFYVLQERASTNSNIKPTETFINLRSSKEREKWICFFCKGICKCFDCKIPLEKFAGTSQPGEQIKSGVVKIDNFEIIEDESIENSIASEHNMEDKESNIALNVSNTNNAANVIPANNIQTLLNKVEIRGIKNKIIKKQCIFCKSDSFEQGEIFKFESVDQFLEYLKFYSNDESNLTFRNSKNINFLQNKEKLDQFTEAYYKNPLNAENRDFKKAKYFCKNCLELNLTEYSGFEMLIKNLNIKNFKDGKEIKEVKASIFKNAPVSESKEQKKLPNTSKSNGKSDTETISISSDSDPSNLNTNVKNTNDVYQKIKQNQNFNSNSTKHSFMISTQQPNMYQTIPSAQQILNFQMNTNNMRNANGLPPNAFNMNQFSIPQQNYSNFHNPFISNINYFTAQNNHFNPNQNQNQNTNIPPPFINQQFTNQMNEKPKTDNINLHQNNNKNNEEENKVNQKPNINFNNVPYISFLNNNLQNFQNKMMTNSSINEISNKANILKNIQNINSFNMNFSNQNNNQSGQKNISNLVDLESYFTEIKRELYWVQYHSLINKIYTTYFFNKLQKPLEDLNDNQKVNNDKVRDIINLLISILPKIEQSDKEKASQINEYINQLNSINSTNYNIVKTCKDDLKSLKEKGQSIIVNPEGNNIVSAIKQYINLIYSKKNSNSMESNSTFKSNFSNISNISNISKDDEISQTIKENHVGVDEKEEKFEKLEKDIENNKNIYNINNEETEIIESKSNLILYLNVLDNQEPQDIIVQSIKDETKEPGHNTNFPIEFNLIPKDSKPQDENLKVSNIFATTKADKSNSTNIKPNISEIPQLLNNIFPFVNTMNSNQLNNNTHTNNENAMSNNNESSTKNNNLLHLQILLNNLNKLNQHNNSSILNYLNNNSNSNNNNASINSNAPNYSTERINNPTNNFQNSINIINNLNSINMHKAKNLAQYPLMNSFNQNVMRNDNPMMMGNYYSSANPNNLFSNSYNFNNSILSNYPPSKYNL